MIGSRMTRRCVLFGAVAAALIKGDRLASAGPRYRLKLIAGEPQDAALRAGIDIELDHGWKTYWRMPGEAGVPPQFDWSGSVNLKSVEVLWPAPARFIDAGGETVGYKDRVVFPLRIMPEQATDPVRLRLKAFFGVCKEVCIPVDGEAELASWQGDRDAEALLQSFERRVPARADTSSRLRVTRAFLSGTGTLGLTVEGTAPADLDIFVESADTSYFRAPRLIASNTYHIAIEGSPRPDKLKGAKLKLTLVGGNVALEQDVVVD